MKKKSSMCLFVAAALCAVLLIALVGCAATSDPEAEAQTASRNYMSKVSVIMDGLQADLQSFSEAVSDNDIVSMRAQAEKASKTIDSFENLTPPDALMDFQAEYLKACKLLETALADYIDLYAEIEIDRAKEEMAAKQEKSTEADDATEGSETTASDTASKEAQSPDFSAYEKQLKKIQNKYDEGLASLEAADKKASEM